MGVAVTFTDDNATVEVQPGAEAACLVRIENTGSVVDGILLDVLGDAGDWASVEPAEVNLLPGASSTVRVVFRPPRTAELASGDVPFGLRAMSREDPNGSRIEEGIVRVGQFSDLDTSLVPKSGTGRRSARYKLIVENKGNQFERLTVEALDRDVKLAFKAKPVTFEAAPGTATFVRLTASPRKTFFKGPNRTLPFEVSAIPEGGTPVKASGVMLEKQILPEWLLPMLGLAVLAAGLLLALWLTVLRPIVHSAATAAADAGMSAKSAKSAKSAADSARSAAASPPASPASPSSLTVTLANPTILTKTTELATVSGSGSSGGGALPTLVWTSSNPKIAKVSQTGVVTGIRAGSAMITATSTSKSASPSPAPSSAPSSAPSPGPSPSPSTVADVIASKQSAVLSGSVRINVVGKVRVSSAPLPEAAIGKPYSASLVATGGTGSFTWSINGGALPPGLSLSPATGAISGTPTTLGKSKFTVHVADAGPPAQFATGSLTLRVVKPLAVVTSSLPGGTVGAGYRQNLAAVGGTPPYNWSISPGTGTLPAGLQLDAATGAITGTPTSAGIVNFTIQVSDAAVPSQSATESLSVRVVNPLSLTTLTLPTAILNSQYSQSLSAFGGAQPYTWSVSSGSLPAGLTLSPASGVLSGTPTANGTSTFSIQVTDSGQPGLSATRSFTVSVVHGFSVTTSSFAQGKVGQPYTASLSAAGGVTPYVWTLQGTLPPGLTLSPDGTITGTLTSTGDFPFTVQVVDSSSPPLSVTAALTITVVSPLSISASSLGEAQTGVVYEQTLKAVGGTAPYTWAVTSGALPRGLTLAPDTGEISGTAVNTGTSNFTITVTDSDTPAQHSASLNTSISVVEPIVFTEPALGDAVLGVNYIPVTPTHVSGGSGSYRWSITSGVLPAGMSLDPNTGTIGGTPTPEGAQLGNQNFTLTAADTDDPTITGSQQLTIDVVGPLEVQTPVVSVVADNSFSENLNSLVSGGRKPYTFSAVSIDGLTLDPTTGVLSGLPDAPCSGGGTASSIGAGAIEVTCPPSEDDTELSVTDADGSSVTVLLTVEESVAPMVFDPVGGLPDIADGDNYNQPVLVNGAQPSGGYGPRAGGIGGFGYSTSEVSVTGSSGTTANNNGLPCNQVGCNTAQLSIDPSTGQISGTLHDIVVSTTWTFEVHLSDTDPLNTSNQISAEFQLSISAH
ncbi:MAG TPA: putative Ig domain-containing protein [Streptosporangiaceae bacterium]|nr:putative Ig domain-containing protein [Streptosporangiaceae bacterium]